MKKFALYLFSVGCLLVGPAFGQDPVGSTSSESGLNDRIQDLSKTLDKSETVQEVSAGILQPIYKLSEFMAHPWFYWLAFVIMCAGVVSFAGQLLLTKFFLLFKLSLNIKEILGDLLGLVISLVGLVLTTQAATENSSFTSSPAAVVSAAAVGAVLGILFYAWGQGTEFRAASRAKPAQQNSNPPKMR